MPLLPGAEPYSHDGGAVGVLLVHGFTGCPQSLRPWAEHVAEAGFSVSLPRLPGHGTTLADMTLTRWDDWLAEADRAYIELAARCSSVIVGGLSMGGSLALRLAQLHPEIKGLVLVNPAVLIQSPLLPLLPVLKYVMSSLPGVGNDIKKPGVTEQAYGKVPLKPLASMIAGWKTVNQNLSAVTMPVLVLHSTDDHVVPASSTAAVLAGISSIDVIEMSLADSYHVATLDNDAKVIFDESVAFARRVSVA